MLLAHGGEEISGRGIGIDLHGYGVRARDLPKTGENEDMEGGHGGDEIPIGNFGLTTQIRARIGRVGGVDPRISGGVELIIS
ncbi:MAG: hypothetical protein AAF799_05545 [Myxococcota bacterium]